MTLVEWNPIFGVFSGDPSMPGQIQSSLLKSRPLSWTYPGPNFAEAKVI